MVYVRFRDLALNVSADYSDSITIVSAPLVPSGGGGGGGGSPSPDYCPTGDLSGNFYDGKCSVPTVTGTGVADTILLTPSASWIPA